MKKLLIFILIPLMGILTASFGGESREISVSSDVPGKVAYSGFTLTENGIIHIKGKAAKTLDNGKKMRLLVHYGWILESNTRKLVWNAFDSHKKNSESKIGDIIRFDKDLFLLKGNYELYYVGLQSAYFKDKWKSRISSILPDLFGKPVVKDLEGMQLTVSGPKEWFKERDIQKTQLIKHAVVSISGVGNHKSLTKRFDVVKDTRFDIYALGEGVRRDGGIYDYGWIMDVEKHRRIWTMTVRDSVCAGGHEKNILVRDSILLPAGTYELHYVTDETHSSKEWNADPPNDPLSWGISLSVQSEADYKNISGVKYVERHAPFLQMVQVGNNRLVERGFQIKKDLKIRVLCLGERDSSHEMVDFGWIVDTLTGDKIWVMNDRNSQHAGGNYKNRMADDFISLKKGAYIAVYKTDDSHAFDRWNTGPPNNAENWGMTLWTAKKEDYQAIVLFNVMDFERRRVIQKIVRPGNYQFIEKMFHIKETTQVRVFAIGESSDNSMVDFGWIENDDTGRIVWSMTFDKTKNAGGAKKNRQQLEVITLKPGQYKLCFETDGSHAYGSWNATPPDNQDRYGIVVFKDYSKKRKRDKNPM